jgi:glycosyltransferase involved in cell wall biosynthesis
MTMREPVRVLELRSVRGSGGGPEKTIFTGAAKTDPARYTVTVCYIRDDRDPEFGPAQRALACDVDYVEVRERHSFDLRIWSRLRQIVRERRIDIVHAHDYKTDLLAWLLAKTDYVIPLATVHGWAGDSPRERIYYAGDKRILSRYPRLIAVSSGIRDELLRTGTRPERITVVLNAIEPSAFRRDRAREAEARRRLGVPADAFVIGGIGRLDRRKRFDVLVEAVAALRRADRPLFLVIAGEGPARAELETIVQRLKLQDRCKLLGLQPDISLVHHALDLFVQSSEAEGTPNVVLEAMAFETPIVATNVGGTGELVRHDVDGLLVWSSAVEALKAAIERVLSSPLETQQRVASARARIESNLSFDTRMRRIEAVYDELTNARVAPLGPTNNVRIDSNW